MSEQTYLSRISLRKDVPAAALREVLLPIGNDQRTASAHRLIWTLFADLPDRRRDFLWRESRPGEFYVLSRRSPEDKHGLFHIDPPRDFAPSLKDGDRLNFVLRVNATVARSNGPNQRGKPCDIVMDAIRNASQDDKRAESRKSMLGPVATKWMNARGVKCGFTLSEVTDGEHADPVSVGPVQVLGYQVMRMDRGRGKEKLSIGVLDLQGELEVRDPTLFVRSINDGFGRAKAFGCGLMLIKRL